jgi:hypothetical protein
MTTFDDAEDFAGSQRVLQQAVARTQMPLLAYRVMPNHRHLVGCPRLESI